MLKSIKSTLLSGKELLPFIEGGKGIGVSCGQSSGAFAAAGGVGTFSGVNADFYDENGNVIPLVYNGKTRSERHDELIGYSIRGGISQARIAHDIAGGNGRIHMNVLWEMAAVERVLHGILEGAKGLIHGITCGAGMPYKVSEIASKYGVHYYPIVSSMRAFRLLWLRAYVKFKDFLGGVVYEDPWRAGGHNGLSNKESPDVPEDPYPRVVELRKFMNEIGLNDVPIIMAGGVWYLRDWEDWLDNPEIGPIAFQFGTRPLVTKESPISEAWKRKLLSLKEGDVFLNKFSPTGFYSSAVRNEFMDELIQRSDRQIPFSTAQEGDLSVPLEIGARKRVVHVKPEDRAKALFWLESGFTQAMRTPDSTLIFVTPDKENEIVQDQIQCMGCLSACNFSNWAMNEEGTTGRKADPRSYCIQKTLQNIIHSDEAEKELMFAGHNAYKFAEDPFYSNGFIPTVKQLVDRLLTGD